MEGSSLKGHLLVASPTLTEGNFSRTVLLMLEHNDAGAAGVILNRPTEISVGNFAREFLSEDLEWEKFLHMGGPVPGPLLVLFGGDGDPDREIIAGVSSTADTDLIMEILQEKREPSLIIANYAGWSGGQLEAEMLEGSWLVHQATPGLVFWAEDHDFWDEMIRQISSTKLNDLLGVGRLPGDPSRN
ncbi:YqgE/AlgH family protein [Isosphaeraceae bacterium EP7]